MKFEPNVLRKRLAILIIIIFILVYAYKMFDTLESIGFTKLRFKSYLNNDSKETDKLKYILQWTLPNTIPFVYMKAGQTVFKENNCPYTNCFVTADKTLLKDYTDFDVIAFHGPEVLKYAKNLKLPQKRSPHQKYVFVSIESAANYPVCRNRYYLNNFFNWTWTYKMDSDLRWGYISIKDENDNNIGPNKIINWMKPEDMHPVSDELKNILLRKKKTAAWFASNCKAKSKRKVFVDKLKNLLTNYSLNLDVYGGCGKLSCPRDNRACDEMIRKDYHFYLAFENSFSEDYVTEKLLRALEYNAIPILFGGANYSRFLPDGSYLNARELGTEKLAAKMYELINNKTQYIEFFKWTNHYRYLSPTDSVDTNVFCAMCALLNDERKVKQTTFYKDFKSWWNADGRSC